MGLEELFQTVEKETTEPIDTTVTGRIPEWIEGSLYRNGPAKYEFGDTKVNHWFDGMAMLHRFKISAGRVTYQDRFIETKIYRKNTEANRVVCNDFGTVAFPDPCKTWYERLFSHFMPDKTTRDNNNGNVFPIGERLYAVSESNLIQRIDPETLKARGQVDLHKVVSVHGATAHPHKATDGSGALYNFGAIYSGHPKYVIIKITPPNKDADDDTFCEKAEIVAKVPARWRFNPSYMHSFALTPNYVVIIEQVLCLNILKLFTRPIHGKPTADCFEYYPEYPNKFHIIDLKTGQRVNADTDYITDAFATYHHINAYEENGQIVVDIIMAPRPVYPGFNMEKLQGPDCLEHYNALIPHKPTRFVLPLDLDNVESGKNLVTVENTNSTATMTMTGNKKGITREVRVTADVLKDITCEFPQINYAGYNGRKYRYMYAMGTKYTPANSIVKLDVQTREIKTWSEKNIFCSEPVFVAAPDAKDEDDGVVLLLVLTTGADRSAFLLVLDAHNLEEIGRAEAPVKIGLDMHGTFVSSKEEQLLSMVTDF